MKKLLIIAAMVLTAVGTGAQTSLLKVSYEGSAEPNWWPEGKNQLVVEPTPEGLALTNPVSEEGETAWWSQMVLTDDCLTLQKKHSYTVRLTIKVPHNPHRSGTSRDRGSYRVKIGSWEKLYGTEVVAYGDDDFQVVDFDIPKYPYDVSGDGHVIIEPMWSILGTSVIKEVEVLENPLDEPEPPTISETNWENEEYIVWDENEQVGTYEATPEGLAINNSIMQEQIWTPITIVTREEFSLEQGHDYIVRLTMKVPFDGIYRVNMGNWDASEQYEVPVMASDNFQVIDLVFPDFAKDAEYVGDLDDCHVMLGSGWVIGATVVKKVDVYEKLGSGVRGDGTAIKVVKAEKTDGIIYNLSGQKVDKSYKGIVVKNGKKIMAD